MFDIQDRFGNPLKTITTTDDTPTIIDSFTVNDGTSCLVRITVVATESGGGSRWATEKIALVYRDGGGAAIQGVVETIFAAGSGGGASLDITVSGNDVEASVTGVAATTITSKCAMQFIEQ